jgi:hypothetical protein
MQAVDNFFWKSCVFFGFCYFRLKEVFFSKKKYSVSRIAAAGLAARQ